MESSDDESFGDSMEDMMELAAANAAMFVATLEGHENVPAVLTEPINPRTGPRKQRRQFDHARAYECIQTDYLGPDPLFGKEFPLMFRISKPRFERIMQDIMAADVAFYSRKTNPIHGKTPPSLEAKLLLPLKCLAYGVPGHAFCDYFQMSRQLARECREQFDLAMRQLYQSEYLGVPTATQLKEIVELHLAVHGVPGQFGSLDCMHMKWKNCPMEWQGQYKGAKKVPTLVLEAICDHNLYFHHASFGWAGTLNDLTILNLSPFLDRLVDGSFKTLEGNSGATPFSIAGYEFDQFWILVDGIYPPYSRFVSTVGSPIYWYEKRYAKWQESARKDIERAFGVFQGMFQYVARPMLELDLTTLGNRVNCCLILHNMCVSDRIMAGDVHARYKADEGYEGEVEVEAPKDLLDVQKELSEQPAIGLDHVSFDEARNVTRRKEWRTLIDLVEHNRLRGAIIQHKTGYKFNTRKVIT